MTLDYFYGQAGKLFSFYRIPKALFQEQRFQNLSTDAKTLYGILLDRMSLSVKNEWFDKQGRVFIIFTIEDVKRALCCADNKATKLLRELENFGLIERKRRGLGKPSLVYVKNFSSDLSNERVQNRENHESGSPKNACQDPPKSRCNKNKKSKTERNNTNPILSDELEKMKNRKLLEEFFSRSLEIELLLRLYPDDEDTIYQIVDLLVDTCDSKRKLIRIAGDDKPAEVVLSRLKKLNADHIRFVLDCLAANTSPIRNMKQYLLAALFNAPTTIQLYALKRQGARSDLTSSQVGMKLQALDIVGQEAGDSRNQVHRFIRLTNLIPELLDMVDEKKISFNPAVELSYLDESQQRDFLEAMADTQNAPSLSQAQRLKKLAQEGHFSYDVAFAVMGEPKKDELDKVVIKNDTLRKYFPESSTPREMEEKIIGLLEESKTEKVVFRSDSIKKYFPSNYSSEQIENSILKMLDQRMKKRKHEAER